ncbi:DUF2235 domain-containing protein [Amycolatopsis thermoflava]|uniref:DUF2235 domain-containing protein n=1 Tax=Amycolatopsis thermoflava TaxID=84480 RepID=UPI00366033E0
MSRRLIVCCDGTWCDPELDAVTNVRRLHNALAAADSSGREQLSSYRRGVGTRGGLLSRLAAGAIGAGLPKDIVAAYLWLCTTYRPGDQIALFGFSRGAFTARSLAGLVKESGLLDLLEVDSRTSGLLAARAYRHYRTRSPGDTWRGGLRFHFDPERAADIPIDFIGVWDTVGALGVPGYFAGLSELTPGSRYRFHDVELNPHIPYARHALALDEWRRPFTPTRWTPNGSTDMAERWFPGSHMDVGGGHRETGLSDISLQWMTDEAAKCAGIAFHPPALAGLAPDPAGLLHDDDRGVFGVAPPLVDPLLQPLLEVGLHYRPRAVPAVVPGGQGGVLDPSALERQQAQPITGGPYRRTRILGSGQQATIEVPAEELWTGTGLYLEPGRYTFTAAGQWSDGVDWCGPGGIPLLRGLSPRRLAGSVVGEAVGLYRLVRRARGAHAPLAPREVDLPWLYLVGYVANDSDRTGADPEHERIAIGTGTAHEVTEPGYFYAFANDAWGFYGRNSGAVRLTVTRL